MDDPTAKSQHPVQANQLVVVLGMHRSGTSLLTHLLGQAGFYIGREGDLLPGSEWNRDGYFERRSVALANDLILQHCGGNWDNPPPATAIERVNIDATLEPLLAEYADHPRSVIKDPRMCLTFPVWERVLGPGIRILLIRREEAAVAASLIKRDGFPREKCWQLFDLYYARAESYGRRYPMLRMSYEEMFTDRRPRALAELQRFLGIDVDLESAAARIVDPSLQHHKTGFAEDGQT
jgi:hypothetical protein